MKRLIIALLCVAMAMAIAACGAKAPEETEPSSEPLEIVELTVWVEENEVEITEQMAEAFAEQHTDLDIRIKVLGQSENGCTDALLADPEAADVFSFTDDQLPTLVLTQMLLEIEADDSVLNANTEGSLRCASLDGKIYAFPMAVSGGCVLYYDSSFYSPEDVQSLETMAEKAHAEGMRVGIQFGANGGWYLNSFFAGAGLNVSLGEDAQTNMCDWDSEKGMDVSSSVLDLVTAGGLQADLVGNLINMASAGQMPAFVGMPSDGKNAMDAYGEHFACAVLPQFKVGEEEYQMSTFTVCSLVGINSQSAYPEIACEFAAWMTNQENQQLRFSEIQKCPVNREAVSAIDPEQYPALAAMAQMSEYAVPQRVGTNYWTNAAQLGQVLASGWTDELNLEEVLRIRVAGITAPIQ